MKIWIVQTGELVSGVNGGGRKGRCNLLAEKLVERGHDVTWWTSTFDHVAKSHLFPSDTVIEFGRQYRVRFLRIPSGYQSNVSVDRFLHQKAWARRFSEASKGESKPDMILACLPTPEACEACAEYAIRESIPFAIDIRDLWPDVYLLMVPEWLRRPVKALLFLEFRRVNRALRAARGVVGVSQGYLDWGLLHARRNQTKSDAVFPIGAENIVRAFATADAASVAQNYGLKADCIRVVYCGGFGRTSDLRTAIHAARLVQQSGRNNVQFVIVGSGGTEHQLRAYASIAPSVIFTGWLVQEKVEEILSICDIGLCAYSADATQSLPNKLFLYMAAGLPVISSLSGEAEQLIQSQGVGATYRAGDSQSLTKAVIRFVDSREERIRTGEKARDLFEKQFSPQVIYPKFVEHLERIAGKPFYTGGLKQGMDLEPLRERSTVTIVVPCRQEAGFIGQFLDQILIMDYDPALLDFIVVDGMSTDGTRDVLEQYSRRDRRLRMIDNPQKTTACALNLAIRATQSDIIVRLDVHASYPRNYISHLVDLLRREKAENVGALRLTYVGPTVREKAFASLVSAPFANGGAVWRSRPTTLCEVESVYCGCYRREIFDRIGLFDESMIRIEDREFNARLRMAGGRILLDPTLACTYYPRVQLLPYLKWTFSGPFRIFYSRRLTRTPLTSTRNFIPLIFVVVHPMLFFLYFQLGWLAALPLLGYAILALLAGAQEARLHRSWPLFFLLPPMFYLTHMLYGVGGLWGALRSILPGAPPKPEGKFAH